MINTEGLLKLNIGNRAMVCLVYLVFSLRSRKPAGGRLPTLFMRRAALHICSYGMSLNDRFSFRTNQLKALWASQHPTDDGHSYRQPLWPALGRSK